VHCARQDAVTLDHGCDTQPDGPRIDDVLPAVLQDGTAGGVLLLASAGAALAAANSPWAEAYHRLWATTVTVGAAGHDLSLTVHQWINDGLAVFFLLVGLEVKRETFAGELSSPRQAGCRLRPSAGWSCR
jgi:Na+:H+ antiporter, NhaA family